MRTSSDPPASQVSGVVVDDVVAFARRRNAELVPFGAADKSRLTPRVFLETVAAIDRRSRRDAAALVDSTLRRSGLSPSASTAIASLSPHARAALAIAETAVAIARDPSSFEVVVPEPPLPWPQRHELRRLALYVLGGARVVLHARDASELASLVEHASIVDGGGHVLTAPAGGRSIVVRVYGAGEPYRAFREKLEARGVVVRGGPIAHLLEAPAGFGPRDVLAAAYETDLDVLEVRDGA